MTKIPFFHYTHLKTIPKLVRDGQLSSRDCLKARGRSFEDVAVEVGESKRARKDLTGFIPMFPGYFNRHRSLSLNTHLWKHYDEPLFSNSSFFGSLNRTLRDRLGDDYENIVCLGIRTKKVYKLADAGRARFFDQLAIKPEAREFPVKSAAELDKRILEHITFSQTHSEVDLQDACDGTVEFPGDIELIVTDTVEVRRKILDALGATEMKVLVSPLPRVD